MTEPEFPWDAHFEKVRAKGLLAMKLYAVFSRPADGMAPLMAVLPDHLAYQLELEQKGLLFGAGPFADDEEQAWSGEAMVILRAESLEKAKEIAAADPMHKSGARTFRVRPWMLNEGSLTLKVTYSNGSREVI